MMRTQVLPRANGLYTQEKARRPPPTGQATALPVLAVVVAHRRCLSLFRPSGGWPGAPNGGQRRAWWRSRMAAWSRPTWLLTGWPSQGPRRLDAREQGTHRSRRSTRRGNARCGPRRREGLHPDQPPAVTTRTRRTFVRVEKTASGPGRARCEAGGRRGPGQHGRTVRRHAAGQPTPSLVRQTTGRCDDLGRRTQTTTAAVQMAIGQGGQLRRQVPADRGRADDRHRPRTRRCWVRGAQRPERLTGWKPDDRGRAG